MVFLYRYIVRKNHAGRKKLLSEASSDLTYLKLINLIYMFLTVSFLNYWSCIVFMISNNLKLYILKTSSDLMTDLLQKHPDIKIILLCHALLSYVLSKLMSGLLHIHTGHKDILLPYALHSCALSKLIAM